jgi:hypothetical protein
MIQNYAVSVGQQRHDDLERHAKVLLLAEKRAVAWEHWWRLFQDPEVWSDSAKRHAMLLARREYNEATLVWDFACKKAAGR